MSIACPALLPKRAGRQDPSLRRSYPASALLWPCPTPRRDRPPCRGRRSCELHPPGPPFSALRSPFADMPCPLPRRTEPVPVSVASRLVRPSPYLRRVGVRDFPFEACSGLLRVTACQLARPAFSGLCHEASARPITRPRRSSASMLTDNYMRGLLPPTGCPRRKGALKFPG